MVLFVRVLARLKPCPDTKLPKAGGCQPRVRYSVARFPLMENLAGAWMLLKFGALAVDAVVRAFHLYLLAHLSGPVVRAFADAVAKRLSSRRALGSRVAITRALSSAASLLFCLHRDSWW